MKKLFLLTFLLFNSCIYNPFKSNELQISQTREFYGFKNPNNYLILRKDKTCFMRIKNYSVNCEYKLDNDKIFFKFDSYFLTATFGIIKNGQIVFTDEIFTQDAPKKF